MIKQYISIEVAKEQTNDIYNQVIERLKLLHNHPRYNIIMDSVRNTSITWKKIGFTAAGKTIKENGMFPNYRIEMNINYLYSEDAEQFIRYTLIHEIAHIVADRFNGSWGHNRTFKDIDMMLGGRGTRCCDYKTPTNKPNDNRIGFLCTHCGAKFNLTPYMLKKCKSGNYYCKKCHTNMKDIIDFYHF